LSKRFNQEEYLRRLTDAALYLVGQFNGKPIYYGHFHMLLQKAGKLVFPPEEDWIDRSGFPKSVRITSILQESLNLEFFQTETAPSSVKFYQTGIAPSSVYPQRVCASEISDFFSDKMDYVEALIEYPSGLPRQKLFTCFDQLI